MFVLHLFSSSITYFKILKDWVDYHRYQCKLEQHECVAFMTLWLQDFHICWFISDMNYWISRSRRRAPIDQTRFFVYLGGLLPCYAVIIWSIEQSEMWNQKCGEGQMKFAWKGCSAFLSFILKCCKDLAWNNRRDHFYFSTNIGFLWYHHLFFLISIQIFPFSMTSNTAIYLDLSASRGNLTCVDVGWLGPCCDVISGKIMKCLRKAERYGALQREAKERSLLPLQCITKVKGHNGSKRCVGKSRPWRDVGSLSAASRREWTLRSCLSQVGLKRTEIIQTQENLHLLPARCQWELQETIFQPHTPFF